MPVIDWGWECRDKPCLWKGLMIQQLSRHQSRHSIYSAVERYPQLAVEACDNAGNTSVPEEVIFELKIES